MLVEGIQIYVAIVMVFQMERKRKYFYLIGWGECEMSVDLIARDDDEEVVYMGPSHH